MKNTILMVVLIAITWNGYGQNEKLAELLQNPKKLAKVIQAPPGRNEIRNWQIRKGHCTEEDYQVPKKVALLSFYIKDSEYTTFSNSGYVSTRATQKATKDNVNALAQLIYDQCIDSIQTAFSTLGMELLEPHEFLDTPEKVNAYLNFSAPKMEAKTATWGLGGDHSAVPAGFRLLPYNHILLTGKKYTEEKNAFLTSIGAEAYMIISIDLSAAGDLFQGVAARIEYRNPALGSETIYEAYHENVYALTKFDAPFNKLFIREEREYVDKKGKTKTKMVPIGVDPGVPTMVTIMSKITAESLYNWIQEKK
ncbi:MAG: hypothetical protein KDC12_10785 [Flavobacteriales bacterium]|nr:hypothetical protein [Flavobacteriales bacterium]